MKCTTKKSMTDKDYLDWVEKYLLEQYSSGLGTVAIVYSGDNIKGIEGKGLRDAIDNAISKA